MNRKLSEEGKQALLAVKEQILKHPESLNMDSFFCGTACCLAGHLALQNGWIWIQLESKNGYLTKDDKMRHPANVGADVLGLSDQEAGALFFLLLWPMEFRRAYDDIRPTFIETGSHDGLQEFQKRVAPERARITAARIDHFIEHGE